MSLKPTQLFLEGDDFRAAVSLVDQIEAGIRLYFDKDSMRVKVKLNHKPSGPIKLYAKKVLEENGWRAIHFSNEDGAEFFNAVTNITPEEKAIYLNPPK